MTQAPRRIDTSPSLLPRKAARQAAPLRPKTLTLPPRRVTSHVKAPPPAPRMTVFSRVMRGAVLVGVMGGSAAGVMKVAELVESSDALPVRAISVSGLDGAALTPEREAEVLAYAEVAAGAPLFSLHTDEIASRIERHPFVKDAHVERRAPDGLSIAVELRAAAAVLRHGAALYMVDADGALMKQLRPGDAVDVPLITVSGDVADVEARASGPTINAVADEVAAAMAVLDAAASLGLASRTSEVVAVPGAGFDIILTDGTRARLGDADFAGKLSRLVRMEQQLHAQGRKAAFMWLDDARRPERIAVRLRQETETSPAGG